MRASSLRSSACAPKENGAAAHGPAGHVAHVLTLGETAKDIIASRPGGLIKFLLFLLSSAIKLKIGIK
jgi:hypothetical protein